MLSRYDITEEIQHYVSCVKNHYIQLQAQYPELDTRVLFQHLEDVNHRVNLYKLKVKQRRSVDQMQDGCSTSASKIRTPPQINRAPPQINRAPEGPGLRQASTVAPPRVNLTISNNSRSSSPEPPPYTSPVLQSSNHPTVDEVFNLHRDSFEEMLRRSFPMDGLTEEQYLDRIFTRLGHPPKPRA